MLSTNCQRQSPTLWNHLLYRELWSLGLCNLILHSNLHLGSRCPGLEMKLQLHLCFTGEHAGDARACMCQRWDMSSLSEQLALWRFFHGTNSKICFYLEKTHLANTRASREYWEAYGVYFLSISYYTYHFIPFLKKLTMEMIEENLSAIFFLLFILRWQTYVLSTTGIKNKNKNLSYLEIKDTIKSFEKILKLGVWFLEWSLVNM